MAHETIVRASDDASPVTLRVLVHDALADHRMRDAWLASPLPHALGFARAAAYFGVRLEIEDAVITRLRHKIAVKLLADDTSARSRRTLATR